MNRLIRDNELQICTNIPMNDSGNNTKLLYPELSYKITGLLFEIYNQLGPGHKEKYYENALRLSFQEHNILFQQQLYTPLEFKGKAVGKYYLDFLIEDKIVLELKQGNYFSQQNIQQVLQYLRTSNLQLGIIAQFTSNSVKIKRIVNIKN
jgi:GxxExxY protein